MLTRIALFLILIAFVARVSAQQPDPNSPHEKTVSSLVNLLEQDDDNIDEAAKLILSLDNFEELKEQVTAIREYVKTSKVNDVMLQSSTQGALVYELAEGVATIRFTMTTEPPVRVNSISASMEDNDDSPASTWEMIESIVDQAAAKDGFEGVVLITRNGKTFLNKSYGYANREKKIKNTTETVFAIGSAPIDFTHAGILMLKDQGKLTLDDPITKHFTNVPEDKRSITIRHLMTGRSGLPDFHGLPSDKNQDHTWIDRDEAVKRIFAQELLFEPGQKRRHSHSAWGLLAAIIEITSGETYQQFTTERLFKPAGMNDTGFFGDDISEDRIAVGYGHKKSSDPNSPPHWGKTSWLVMGSGGQVSTLSDMLRWETAMKNGRLLSPESTRLYLRSGDGVSADGDMFGFEFMHSRNPDQLFMVISNTVDSREKRRKFDALGRTLNRLVRENESPPKYSLGVSLSMGAGDGVTIEQVGPGSAAEKGGLQQGDVLVSANGKSFGEVPMEILRPLLGADNPIEFRVRRNGEMVEVVVTPTPVK